MAKGRTRLWVWWWGGGRGCWSGEGEGGTCSISGMCLCFVTPYAFIPLATSVKRNACFAPRPVHVTNGEFLCILVIAFHSALDDSGILRMWMSSFRSNSVLIDIHYPLHLCLLMTFSAHLTTYILTHPHAPSFFSWTSSAELIGSQWLYCSRFGKSTHN